MRAQRRRAALVAARKRTRAAVLARARRAKTAAAARRATAAESASAGFSDADSGISAGPFLLAGLLGAVLLLGVALTPARAVPWTRASRALDDRRQEVALLGASGLVATGFFFLLAMMSG
ncbi:MAG: hypothetical protein H0V11_06920 [Actinobacteria bacterium]|nr:hypothetical protein [Actinomycetota bacterium]